jgi:hypothetical protein
MVDLPVTDQQLRSQGGEQMIAALMVAMSRLICAVIAVGIGVYRALVTTHEIGDKQ